MQLKITSFWHLSITKKLTEHTLSIAVSSGVPSDRYAKCSIRTTKHHACKYTVFVATLFRVRWNLPRIVYDFTLKIGNTRSICIIAINNNRPLLPSLIRIFDVVNVRLTMLIFCLYFLHFICLTFCLKENHWRSPIEVIMLPKGFNFKRRLTLSFWLRPIYHIRTGGCVWWVCRLKRVYRD